MARRPSFLLIVTDQQRADHLGCYGNPQVRTPNIDSIGRAGWRADAFHVASPICMPNRATMLTGRMPSVHGVRHNGIPLGLRATTFVELLRQAGWRTALVGKAHLQNMTGKPALYPPAGQRLALEAEAPDGGRYDQESAPAWRGGPGHDVALPFYGYDTVHLTVEHGDEAEGHYRRWLLQREPGAARLTGPDHALPAPDYALTRIHQAWRTRLPEELSTSAYVTETTLRCLDAFAAADEPFFIQCSYPDPHHPLTPPGRYWDMFAPAAVELPASFRLGGNHPPPHVAWLYEQRDAGTAVRHTPALFACSEREAREFIALTYGSLAQIDDGVGRLLRRLEELGRAGDTVVIFTSDHGEFAGDHQLLLKGPIHYRGLIRAPFLWRDPARAAGRSAALCGTIDIAPTVLERAGVAPFNGIQGVSLLPLIDGGAAPRRSLLIEEEGQRAYLGFAGRVRMRTLLTDRWRLSVYAGADWGELYDLEGDPHELTNLWSDPARLALRSELLQELAVQMIAHADPSPAPTALA